MPILLGTDSWNLAVGGLTTSVFKASSKVTKAVSNQLTLLGLTRSLWSIDSELKDLLEDFYKTVSTESTVSDKPLTEERIREGITSLRSLCEKIEELYGIGKGRGLTNRRLAGTALNSIRVRGEELWDIAEAIEMSLDPKTFEPSFNKAFEEYQRGETHDLASIL